jgi:hypothetical protein
LLDYFVNLRTVPLGSAEAARCRALLVQAGVRRAPPVALQGWRETWRGSRPGDRNEAFILYVRDP